MKDRLTEKDLARWSLLDGKDPLLDYGEITKMLIEEVRRSWRERDEKEGRLDELEDIAYD